jgi:hypothetical protein
MPSQKIFFHRSFIPFTELLEELNMLFCDGIIRKTNQQRTARTQNAG